MMKEHECDPQKELDIEISYISEYGVWCVSPAGTLGRGTYPIKYCPACGAELADTN